MDLTGLTFDRLESAREWMNGLTQEGETGSVADILLVDAPIDREVVEAWSQVAVGTAIGAVESGLDEGIARRRALMVGLSICYEAGALAMLKALTDLAEQDGA